MNARLPPAPTSLTVATAAPLPGTSLRGGRLSRFVRYLVRHPVLCLVLLSPGIPEYISSSSKIALLVLNPIQFFLLWALNAALYGPGVLLIREAVIRWKKGWGAVLLLGAAYGILEEGIALATLFDPTAGPVGVLGSYGHFLGVNWVWAAGLLMFHPVYSIALPILLFQLAIPELKGRSLLSARGLTVTAAVLVADVVLLLAVIVGGQHFWLGPPLLAGSLLAIAGLVLAAYRLPAGWLRPRIPAPSPRLLPLALAGVALFPGELLLVSIPEELGVPSSIVLVLVALWYLLLMRFVLGRVGRSPNEPQLLALAVGLLLPVAVFGFFGSLPFPLVLLLDLFLALFLSRLWTRHVRLPLRLAQGILTPPVGALR